MAQGESEASAQNGLPYSVKLEDTSKGVRVTVHVYAATIDEARDLAVRLRDGVCIELENKKVPVAPMEANSK